MAVELLVKCVAPLAVEPTGRVPLPAVLRARPAVPLPPAPLAPVVDLPALEVLPAEALPAVEVTPAAEVCPAEEVRPAVRPAVPAGLVAVRPAVPVRPAVVGRAPVAVLRAPGGGALRAGGAPVAPAGLGGGGREVAALEAPRGREGLAGGEVPMLVKKSSEEVGVVILK